MKKILTLLAALLPIAAAAQITPEAIIGGCPVLPTAAELVTSVTRSVDEQNDRVLIYQNRLSEYRKACEAERRKVESAGLERAKTAFSREMKQSTGKTTEQWQSMNEEQLDRESKSLANRKMRELGIEADVSALEKMSDAEKERAAMKMASQMTGMSVAEMQKIASMNEEEAMAYMQSSGAGQRVAEHLSASARQPAASSALTVDAMERMREIADEVRRYQEKLRTDRELWEAKTAAVHTQADKLWESKYRPAVVSLEEQCDAAMRKTTNEADAFATETRYAASIGVQYRKFYEESIPIWIEHVKALMAYHKSSIPEARRFDALNLERAKLSGPESAIRAAEAIDSAVECALSYLDAAFTVVQFPSAGSGRTGDS